MRTVTIIPAGDNNVMIVIEGETQTYVCTTDSSRPAASIQWYIGGQNVTNQATPQQPQQDGDKLISSSSLVYTGRDVDHSKVIFCEGVNIEGRQKVKSTEKSFYIQCKYMDVVEWSRTLDVRLSEWCCSVTMVWVQIPSREEQKIDSSKI